MASLLGLRLDEVTPFYPNPEQIAEAPNPEDVAAWINYKFWRNFEQFFIQRGFPLWRIDAHVSFNVLHLACGPSERGCNHMVVMQNGNVVHDPHPSRAGLLSVKHCWVPVPVDVALHQIQP